MSARDRRRPGAPGEEGFTILEFIIASTVVLLVAGALAATAQPARRAFDRVPAELDLQQRGRTAIDAIAQQVRASLAASSDVESLTVAVPMVHAGQGVVDAEQVSAASSLVLSTVACPNIKDVCGFTAGSLAIVMDATGRDQFSVAAVSSGTRSVTPGQALSHSYPAGAEVVAVDQYTFALEEQADGSYTLIRRTAAGAVQPIVDFVSDLSFTLTSRQIDVSIRVHPAVRSQTPARGFAAAVALRNRS
jgi:hypothetical protein